MKYNCKECGYHWVTNLNSSLICRNFTVLLSYYVIKFFRILLEEPLAWKASRKIKLLVLKSRLARKIKFRLWQVIVEKEASPLTMMINKIATKQLEVRWETPPATQPGRQTVELRDNDDDDGPYIISYGLWGFCLVLLSARVYLTLHRVLAPSTHETPSKLVWLRGEHFLTFTGTITFFIRMSHCFTWTVWQCSQSSTYLALHCSWQPASTVPRRTKTMMTTGSGGGGGEFMVLISVWREVIWSDHNNIERPTCPTVPPWLRSLYTV